MTDADTPTSEVPVTYEADVVGPHEGDEVFVDRRKRRTPLGLVVRVVVVLSAVALTYFVVTLYQVWSTGRRDEARPVDAIVVLGAAQYDGRPSPQLAARLDHVIALWPEGLAPIVVVTGGKQPADRFTEAEASARYLIERGVPEGVLLFENEGRSTYESLDGVADMLRERGLRTVLLVTDPFHALRSRLTAEELGLDAYVSPTGTSVVTGGSSFTRHLKEAAGVSFGRIIGFDRLRGLTG
jgi:uncharacterized SAM-binding protein YcdF (DUF218 family)